MMTERTLVSAERAAELIRAGARVIDARFELAAPEKGAAAYAESHLPGAVYLHLDRDLSDHSRVGHGRHPLPEPSAIAATFSRIGLAPDDDVIVYDDGNGAHAARVWWMLRYVGHVRVAVLEGGFEAWKAAELPLETAVRAWPQTRFVANVDGSMRVESDDVIRGLADGSLALVDARAANRFRGEIEPLDTVAGHVPGALNRPFADNLSPDGRFKAQDILREEFAAIVGDREPSQVAAMCGSGVTACHNLLAMEHAGLRGAKLYADSWSGWISDPARPVAKG